MPSELLAGGLCIDTISPTLIQYQATEYVPVEHKASYENARPLRRAQYSVDIAGIVMYELLALSDSVSGQNLPVNGGLVFN